MTRPVPAIRNLGPRSVEAFARAGINSAEELIALGADEGYARLIAAGTRAHFIGFRALALGLQGRPWTDLAAEEKAALRARFDAIKAAGPRDERRAALEAALERLGVGAPQPTSSRPEKK